MADTVVEYTRGDVVTCGEAVEYDCEKETFTTGVREVIGAVSKANDEIV